MSSRGHRLKAAYQTGGLSGLATTLTGYVRWRLSGSPPDPPLSLEERLERTDSAVIVALMRDYCARATPATTHLISVILPTRDRPVRLLRAIQSVIEQTYPNWELIVVNDSTRPLPMDQISQDHRIRVVAGEGVGVGAARNRGLDSAQGDLIAFLDDDNLMDPHWLNALAATLDQAPETQVVIGAQLVTPDPGEMHQHFVRFPDRFDWDRLTEANYVDMAMLAHRPNQDVRFDESLPAFVDWDYVVRLTLGTKPVLVPALCGLYLTDSPGRISYSDRQELVAAMVDRFSAMRPTEPSLAERELGRHDVSALGTMLRRLGGRLDRPPAVILGSSTPLVESLAGEITEEHADYVGIVGEADVLITDALPNYRDMGRVRDDGFVVGLTAHEVSYQELRLPHSRSIGDHLWVGSRIPFNPEDLFEGATLVKFGVARER